ncbi:MAG: hypothetical protein AB1666_08470 [Pseudomonadota bacterium]|uniref:hypothetical protein n=1 Tax=Caldimonas aquatica TaxID=376175 RepID=UPI002C414867|nr:hypothetical protein [Burkholderiaceae bacterium]
MPDIRPLLTAAAVALLLAGCAPLPEVTEVRQVKVPVRVPVEMQVQVFEPTDAAARHALAYFERARAMPPAEQQKELARLAESRSTPSVVMEQAIVLGFTRGPNDLQRALVLLDALLKSTAPDVTPWHPFARLLQARYQEQRRVEEQLDRQNQRLLEAQRRLDQVNEKLEALKAIERSLAPRTAPPSPLPAQPPAPPSPASTPRNGDAPR